MKNDGELFEGATEGLGEAKESKPRGAPRVQRAERRQVKLVPMLLDELLPEDHRARLVWEWTESLNLEDFYEAIHAVESGPGRPAIDPQIYLALWLFATLEGVGSARALARLCQEHVAYRWICGGVGVNRDGLAAFRREHEDELDNLLTESVAGLISEGLVELSCIAQDGMRVRADASTSSLRSPKVLRKLELDVRRRVRRLRKELETDPGALTRRQAGAQRRAGRERKARIQRALRAAEGMQAERDSTTPSKQRRYHRQGVRASTTDPDARKMRMGNGGSNVALNAQLATETSSQVIVGVDVVSATNDAHQLCPMVDQVERRYGCLPKRWLVDAGYTNHAHIEALEGRTEVYAPPMRFSKTEDPCAVRPKDSLAIARWKRRMADPGSAEIFRQRAPVAEGVNAQARNRGLQRFPVRGIRKARAVMLMYALAHNLQRRWALSAA